MHGGARGALADFETLIVFPSQQIRQFAASGFIESAEMYDSIFQALSH